jgi:hypothetical protein
MLIMLQIHVNLAIMHHPTIHRPLNLHKRSNFYERFNRVVDRVVKKLEVDQSLSALNIWTTKNHRAMIVVRTFSSDQFWTTSSTLSFFTTLSPTRPQGFHFTLFSFKFNSSSANWVKFSFNRFFIHNHIIQKLGQLGLLLQLILKLDCKHL